MSSNKANCLTNTINNKQTNVVRMTFDSQEAPPDTATADNVLSKSIHLSSLENNDYTQDGRNPKGIINQANLIRNYVKVTNL